MNFYLDTEFLEGKQKRSLLGINLGNTTETIDLISVGLVAETGEEYYAISKEFNIKEAWNRCDIKADGRKVYWIRENILKSIWKELEYEHDQEYQIRIIAMNTEEDDKKYFMEEHLSELSFTYSRFKYLIKKYGKKRTEIAKEVLKFVYTASDCKKFLVDGVTNYTKPFDKIKFYGYFCDYDWVAFCWLFGKMIDLPKYFPMYCRDLKHAAAEIYEQTGKKTKMNLKHNEHNALSDAKWNLKFHEFLNDL